MTRDFAAQVELAKKESELHELKAEKSKLEVHSVAAATQYPR